MFSLKAAVLLSLPIKEHCNGFVVFHPFTGIHTAIECSLTMSTSPIVSLPAPPPFSPSYSRADSWCKLEIEQMGTQLQYINEKQ